MFFGITQARPGAYRTESRQLLQLAWPMLIAQSAQVATGFVDTVMAGRVSTDDLAAVSLGSSVFVIIYVTLMGAAVALNPIIAHQFGAQETERIGQTGRQGLWFGLLLGIIGTVLMILSQPLLRAILDLPPAVMDKTMLFLTGITLGMPAAMLHRALHAYASSLNRPVVIMIVSVTALALNIPLNYILIHGLFGMPRMGGAGCGWGTAIVFWFNFLTLFTYIAWHRYFRPFKLTARFDWPDWRQIAGFFKLGSPIALSYFLEVSLFCAIVLLISRFGTQYVASQQSAINFTSLIYMVPQSIATALSVRVGQHIGAGNYQMARFACGVGLSNGMVAAILSCLLILLARMPIMHLYTKDPQVIVIGSTLLIWAAFNQLADATQTIASGALRGYKLTAVPMLIHAVSFWGIGLMLGCYLGLWGNGTLFGYALPLKIYGFWAGLAVSLFVAAGLLIYYLSLISRQRLQRQVVPLAPDCAQ